MARCVQGTGGGAFNVDDPFEGEVVPPALDLSELAQATTWWVQWAPVTGKLPAVPGPGPTLFLAERHMPASSASAPGRSNADRARRPDSRGPAQDDPALSGWPRGLTRSPACQAPCWELQGPGTALARGRQGNEPTALGGRK